MLSYKAVHAARGENIFHKVYSKSKLQTDL